MKDFVEEPHTGIVGEHQGTIMNLVDAHAKSAQHAMLDVASEHPEKTLRAVGNAASCLHLLVIAISACLRITMYARLMSI